MTDSTHDFERHGFESAERWPGGLQKKDFVWSRALIWFMRAMALFWIVKGLSAWATILGIGHAAAPFEKKLMGFQATTIYFAVIDLVAAVGLWLTSTWGGVMWLLAVVSHLILAIFFPFVVASTIVLSILLTLCVMAYLTVSWLAAAQE